MSDRQERRERSRSPLGSGFSGQPYRREDAGTPPLQIDWARPLRGGSPQEPSTSYSPEVRRREVPLQPSIAGPSRSAFVEQQPQQVATMGGGGEASSSISRGASARNLRLAAELLLTRPQNLQSKQGTGGQQVQLQANYFRMLTATDWCLYKYRVDFDPEEDKNSMRKGLLKIHKPTLGGYIFDGTILYTSHRLPEPLEVSSVRRTDEVEIKITIRLVDIMAKGDEHYLQFYNIIMRKCLEHLQLQLVGRNFFDAANKVEVPQWRLELWPGYETSIRQHERNILMCCEITHKVMRQETLLDILNECYSRHGDNYQARYSAQVIGLTVLTAYNNETYRVDDVAYNVSPQSTFLRRGEDITYMDYYQQRHQIHIRHQTQPMLVSRSKSRQRRAGISELVYLVPELCRSTGLSDEMRGNFNMMRELASYTRLNPNDRIQRLLSFNRRLDTNTEAVNELKEWNMKLDNKLVTIPARIFEPERIGFGGQCGVISAGDQADWTRDLRNKQMFRTATLQKWFMIVPNFLLNDSEMFIRTIRSSVRSMNFPISDPEKIVINDDRANAYTCAIEDIMSHGTPQLIMCVVKNNRADRYSAIKKKCCIDRPVPSQCILGKNLNGKGAASIATKVAVQMNCKIGGAPWTVNFPLKGLMVVGFDVCHDTNARGRDFGALVASLDIGCSKYFSVVSPHSSGEELSDHLGNNMIKAVQKYREANNGSLPTRIVIYRDGVGEGQIPYVYEHEVENVKSKLAGLYGSLEQVNLAYIIVTKRLNTRLFLNGNNPPPGTIVDDVITNPLKYDFFIVSQFIKQGSVSPTAYSVIYDTVRLDVTKIQKLTYKLTHMYFNWSGTVRVPAPCQLAHKLAFLVSQSLHAHPSQSLENLLYYL